MMNCWEPYGNTILKGDGFDLWKGRYQKVCEIEVKITINEMKVLNGYLKSSCKGLGG
jgi:hypothetical protein